MALTVQQRIDMAARAHAEGRIIQGAWRKGGDRDGGGRELVCALAAFGPDINDASNCPADLMPRWLAHLVPRLDDGIRHKDVPWFSGELIARARRWHELDTDAWDRIRTGFMVFAVEDAVRTAEAVQPSPKPDYWQKVADACAGVVTALKSGEGLAEARAEAAAAAAAAAEAAAARWAAAEAAAAAAAARWVAAAARWAAAEAYKRLAERLFQLIDAELAD
ncbi:hypothetical protein MNQ96_01320 [Sphingopyxis granuli]|uniref:hypothetical protein n=1 Tax=Sphingopyxis granuli TaxID=267128 RepID=UPI001F5365F0|nr:hypothetical protein [Sphingopyxis granuli]UNK79763.1 hypothetical protein MNQ96_01320 [Sphingopyxis granuli]